jgi:NAD(P)H-flavin reductase
MECLDSETVLDTLLRNDVVVPYSCRSGHCQSCILQASKGSVPKSAQKGLKDTFREQNYFLACQCVPAEVLHIASPADAELYEHAVVREKTMLAENICQLIIEPAMPLYYHAGQFINLRKNNGLVRSYSLASLPQTDSCLELHIKRFNNGEMSQWLMDELDVGQSVDIQGPYGTCYYSSGEAQQNLLLIGTGTGLSPLIGIIKDALHSKHQGEIFLYHGSRSISGLYYQSVLAEIEKRFPQFHYISCLSGDDVPQGVLSGRAHDVAMMQHPNLKDWNVYLCGDPAMVATAKKMAYLGGAKLSDIYADPFELTDLRKSPRKT